MTDIVDQAQEREAEVLHDAHVERVLALMRAREQEIPLVVAGNRLCIDCDEKIPKKRLEKMPHAVRCVGCQTIEEQRIKGRG